MPPTPVELKPEYPDGPPEQGGLPHFPLHEGVPRVVVLGCGFGGLTFCKKFKGARGADGQDVQVALVDKQNHHLFQPLLYQVAMAGLAVPEVAEPIRSIFRGRNHLFVSLDEITGVDLQAKRVRTAHASLEYTHLVIGLGGQTSYFGNDHWAEHAPGLKTVHDALRIRSRLLTSFEHAETEPDARERRRLMTVVVVGGGPTGVELAGTVADLSRHIFRKDFRHINTTNTRVILVDGSDRLLEAYPPELSASAKRQIEGLGVQVMLETRVTDIDADSVTLDTGERIETRNVLWGGGVVAPPLTRELGVELGPGGRITVGPDLSVPGHPEVFAIGDIAWVTGDDGQPVPGVAPAAMQMGKHVAKVLKQEITAGATPPAQRRKFRYWDKGTMATIGRKKAVAWVGPLKFSGTPAWLAWAMIHLLFLVGFRNKIVTMIQWCFNYLAFRPGARILFSSPEAPKRV